MLKFNNGITLTCGPFAYFDVYMIDIDDDRIELSDNTGMVIGTISTAECLADCEVIEYGSDGRMLDNQPTKLMEMIE